MKAENILLYDLAVLKNQTGNDADFLHQMVILFIKQTVENLEKIDAAIRQNNWSEIHFIVHKMKSAINLFGIKSLQQIIIATEELTRDKSDEKKIVENLKLIDKILKECMEQLKMEFSVD
ncbi:MAG: Hpt domain-containing protein [Chitinophagaceae bacterium]